MKRVVLLLVSFGGAALAQQHELALSLGGFTSTGRLSGGKALGAAYSYRLTEGDLASLYVEIPVVSGPLRDVGLRSPGATRDVATLYVTPALRVKLSPDAKISPFFSVGGGYALYEQSTLNQGGQPNAAPRTVTHGAFMFGGGVDVKFWKFVSLRGEVRDFFTGNPAYNFAVSGGQHNVVASAALVFRWR